MIPRCQRWALQRHTFSTRSNHTRQHGGGAVVSTTPANVLTMLQHPKGVPDRRSEAEEGGEAVDGVEESKEAESRAEEGGEAFGAAARTAVEVAWRGK